MGCIYSSDVFRRKILGQSADSETSAYIADAKKVTAGTLSIATESNTDGKASADASATGSMANFGVGVAINAINTANRAYIGNGAEINAGGITISAATKVFNFETTDASGATMIETDDANSFKADAAAGASLGTVSIAGGVAINVVTNTTDAYIGQGSNVINGGNVTIAAGNRHTSEVTAKGTVGEFKQPTEILQDTAIDALAFLFKNSSKNKTGTAIAVSCSISVCCHQSI